VTARTAIVTDSTCNLSVELAAEKHIYVTPLYVIWDEVTYRDGIDISELEFYQRLVSSGDIPKTSQASVQDFVTLFQKARDAENADAIVCPVLSSDLSGTYASAVQAKEQVDFPVYVVDTRQITWALGHIVLSAAAARDAGANPEEIAQVVQNSAQRQSVLFTIDSLEYIRRGGRIGNARLLLGSALHIKPVLEIRGGIVESVENVRTRKRAVEYLLKAAAERAGGCAIVRASVIHGNVPEEAEALRRQAIETFHPQESYLSYACTSVGVHTGPRVLGVVVEWADSAG
jgi:DegV family protein with EDD domain